MSKLGKPYQNAVAEVVRAFDPGARIQENEWIQGPDGNRECDVTVRGQVEGRETLALIECKDWKKNIPVGLVDELHSKAPDTGADLAVICSNSNFSKTALRKAERVGIIAVSALQTGDLRVRTGILQPAVLQEFQFCHLVVTASTRAGNLFDLIQIGIRRSDQFLNEWFAQDLASEIVAHPQDNHLIFSYDLKSELTWEVDGFAAPLPLQSAQMEVFYQRRWLKGKVEIKAERGLYNHVTARLAVAPRTQFSIEIDNVKWKPAPDQYPETEPVPIGAERLILSRVVIPQILISGDKRSPLDLKIEEVCSARRVVVGPEKPPHIRRRLARSRHQR